MQRNSFTCMHLPDTSIQSSYSAEETLERTGLPEVERLEAIDSPALRGQGHSIACVVRYPKINHTT